MGRPIFRCGSFAVLLSIATGFLVHACDNPNLVETFGEKAELSVLQGIELQEREYPLTEPVIRIFGDSEVLGVRGIAGSNIWVLLNVQSPPFYKQLPKGNYEIPETLVRKLQQEQRASYTVIHVLQSHVH